MSEQVSLAGDHEGPRYDSDTVAMATSPVVKRRSAGWAVALLSVLVLGLFMAAAVGIWYAWPSDQPVLGGLGDKADTPISAAGNGPPGAPPVVAPVKYIAVSQQDARQINAAVPFVTSPNPAAAPYYFTGLAEDREKALTCLTSAAYYEAGNDPPGMAAVIQVVLNRSRHPAFPPTVCGTVFQGSERRTGCQFTYTCDGALARTPDPAIWARARVAAELALSGFVYAPVGTATHYHTDWVVPYWGAELDKLVAVHTHLFFRFKGAWGRPAAFRQKYAGGEAIDPRIAGMSNMPRSPAPAPPSVAAVAGGGTLSASDQARGRIDARALPVSAADLGNNVVRLADPAVGLFVVQLDPAAFPGGYAVLAYKLCANHSRCRVVGWRAPGDVPSSLPLPSDWRSQLSFLFEKGVAGGQSARWNCNQTPRDNKAQCL